MKTSTGPSTIAKAYVIGSETTSLLEKADKSSTDAPDEGVLSLVVRTESLEPPYDPTYLSWLYEHANALRQNVDAYKTNIDGFGHGFEPLIDLRHAGARDLVSDALMIEAAEKARQKGTGDLLAKLPPSDEDIDKKIAELKYTARLEKARAESFFDNCVADESFVSLRRRTREDIEVTGNGYWEVIRNDAGELSQFAYMPSRSMRVAKKRSKTKSVNQRVKLGALAFRDETFRRSFRRYMQVGSDDATYFKEFGDSSTILSSKTGREFNSPEELLAEEGADVAPANECIHFKIHSQNNGSYGVPRWIGNLLSILGSRSAEEVNLAYFESKSIPPLAVLVSGGRLAADAVTRIQDFVEKEIKGKKNFHKILVIEAETSAGAIGLQDAAGSLRVEIKQLTDAQLKDGLFLQYDAANMDKVGMGFRLPRMLRGDVRDFNRSTAEAALDFAESQVFNPERNDFDFLVNRFVLPEISITLWKFKSNGPRLSDSQSWGEMIAKLTVAGVLTPADAREIAGQKVLSNELPLIKADWVNQPLALTIAGVQADLEVDGLIPLAGTTLGHAAPPQVATGIDGSLLAAGGQLNQNPGPFAATRTSIFNQAKRLLKLRDSFRQQEASELVQAYKDDRVEEAEFVFSMTADEMAEKLGITKNK